MIPASPTITIPDYVKERNNEMVYRITSASPTYLTSLKTSHA